MTVKPNFLRASGPGRESSNRAFSDCVYGSDASRRPRLRLRAERSGQVLSVGFYNAEHQATVHAAKQQLAQYARDRGATCRRARAQLRSGLIEEVETHVLLLLLRLGLLGRRSRRAAAAAAAAA
eukprot:CAMPEP_0115868290 /NCGR_PEP_ID=MMETSP0287-20121206/21215_1 /TAXON_ID=412157 /ORGANISM="Chrysochromulina rotalis, Strain UIO044" /LENGTH=123 /DNA_ID=CAMNT_0003322937 /DNA_START=1425 /DNA_END=1794 /DNA_ORIENTATION=-